MTDMTNVPAGIGNCPGQSPNAIDIIEMAGKITAQTSKAIFHFWVVALLFFFNNAKLAQTNGLQKGRNSELIVKKSEC